MPTVRERIAGGRDAKGRAGLRAAIAKEAVEALWPASGPMAVNRDGLSIVFDERPALIRDKEGTVIGVDAMVRVFRAGNEVKVDPHRICINPPVLVPDGAVDAQGFATFREDPTEAYLSWLVDSLTSTPNAKGWRTKGTVTTVFAGTNDGRVQSGSTTYATARDGGGTVSVDTTSTGDIGAGQFFSSPNYTLWEYFPEFDTSSIGTDTVSSTVLGLYGIADSSSTDFSVTAWLYDWGGTVTTADWRTAAQLSALTEVATFATAGGWSSSGYNSFTETGTAFSDGINGAGTTRIVVGSSRLESGTAPTGAEYVWWYFADQSGTTNDPKLTITHASSGATGTADVTLPNMEAAGTGAHAQSGSGTPTLPNMEASASGAQAQSGTAAATLNNLDAAATGVMQPSGTAAPNLPRLVAAVSGAQTQTGSGTPSLPGLDAAATGASGFDATAAATLPNLEAAGTGAHPVTGTATPSLPNLVAAVSGVQAQAGTAASDLPNVTAAATGTMQPAGTATADLPNVVASGSGAQAIPATGAATLPNMDASGEGGIPTTGTAAVELPNLVAAVIAAVPNGILLPRGGGIVGSQLRRGGGKADVLPRGGGATNTGPRRGGGTAGHLPRGGGSTEPQPRRGGGKVDGS